jgi:pyridoxal 5'-phosphate synthase pdxS subunit
MSQNNGSNNTSLRLKTGLAEMLKGGVVMDVTNAEQAVIAEKAGAVSVMALERVPAQIRAEGGVARMASPKKIREIMDESEVLTPADEAHHVDKHDFKVPFVCGARNLGEALRRIAEGAAMIRTKGEAGTGDVVHAVKHIRQIVQEMKILTVLSEQELYAKAKELQAPYELVRIVAKEGKLPVPNFSAGGIATPADASLVMQLGAEAVFVGSGIFMGKRTTCTHSVERHPFDETCAFTPPEEAEKRARAIVKAATHYQDPKVLLEVSEDLTGAMKGLAVSALDEAQMLQTRGW